MLWPSCAERQNMWPDAGIIQPAGESPSQNALAPRSLAGDDKKAPVAVAYCPVHKIHKIGVGCVFAHTMQIDAGIHMHFAPFEFQGCSMVNAWAFSGL